MRALTPGTDRMVPVAVLLPVLLYTIILSPLPALMLLTMANLTTATLLCEIRAQADLHEKPMLIVYWAVPATLATVRLVRTWNCSALYWSLSLVTPLAAIFAAMTLLAPSICAGIGATVVVNALTSLPEPRP